MTPAVILNAAGRAVYCVTSKSSHSLHSLEYVSVLTHLASQHLLCPQHSTVANVVIQPREQNWIILQTVLLGVELKYGKETRAQKLYMMAGSRTMKIFSFSLSAEVTPPVTKLDGCPGNQPGENSESNSG